MSEQSKEANLNCTEVETAVSEDGVDESGKKLKRNYCYVCRIQCTASKNLQQHEKGKKHIKNEAILRKMQRREQRNYVQPRIDATPSRFSTSSGEDSYASKTRGTEDFSPNAFDKTSMNNFNRRPTKNKRNEYFNADYSKNYSSYHDQRNSYSNQYRGGRRNFNSYRTWTNPKFSSTPYHDNDEFGYAQNNSYYSNSRYNSPRGNEYFTEDRHGFIDSYSDINDDSVSANNKTEDSVHRSESSSQNGENFAPGAKRYFDSSLNSSESPHWSKRRIHNDDVIPSTSHSSVEKPAEVIGSTNKRSSERKDKVTGSAPDKSCTISKTDISKLVEKRRVSRLRSLSASEGCEGKSTSEHQTDSDGASEEQKIKNWTNSLLETNHNQISRLINPSTYKEKAAVNHLITKLSRTKRKEILTRTMRSNSMECTETNSDETVNDRLNTSTENLISACDEVVSSTNSSREQSNQKQKDFLSSTIPKNRKNSTKVSESELNLGTASSLNVVEETSPFSKSSKKSNKTTKSIEHSGVTLNERSPEVRQEKVKAKRRKSETDDGSKGKKQKTSISRSGTRESTELPEMRQKTLTVENFPLSAAIPEDLVQSTSQTFPDLKEELVEITDVNQAAAPLDTSSENVLDQNLVFNSSFSVESLMQLFASGNVKVKEEFNDPVVDAIKEISPDELMSACSNAGEATSQITAEPKKNSKDKPVSEAPVTTSQDDRNITSPSVTTAVNCDAVSAVRNSPLLPNSSSSINPQDQSPSTSSKNMDGSSCKSLSESNNLKLLKKTKSEPSPPLHELIAQLQDIASQEEDVKARLSEAKSKISEHSALLEEWKSKKRKLQTEEDDLRKKRNDIIKSMQTRVEEKEENGEELETTVPKASSSAHQPASLNSPAAELNSQVEASPNKRNPSPVSNSPVSSSARRQKKKANHSPASTESDDITILPIPSKPTPPEIIICDDSEDISPVPKIARNNMVTNVVSKKGPTFNFKEYNAHDTVVNNLVVFEDYLYTCSNDSTGKRFSLKDGSLSVTYIHRLKNVTEIVVEKVQNEALVFTSCSSRLISIFIASSGTKLKSVLSPSNVMSICKGWGKFYSGLSNGSINVYNWKCEEIEIVKTENSVSRIASAHQGQLHVLIILSSEGRISIRDAETGLLIRSCQMQIKHPSWMTLCNDLVYLSTADKELIILDIMSGQIEKQLHLTNHSTGLAVCDDFIFTIAYNGVVNCYYKEEMHNKKLFYGAGKNCLTCIHIYHDWVFTGNRQGKVSLFHFDPFTSVTCKIRNCNLVFGFKEDLVHHIEKTHVAHKKYLTKCVWHQCDFTFPVSSNTKDKMNHMKSHIYEMHL